MSVQISKDDRLIVTGSADGTAKLWDVNSGRCLCTFTESSVGTIFAVAISSDSKFIVTASAAMMLANNFTNNKARIWDIASGKCIHVFETNYSIEGLSSVAMSQDNRTIALGSFDGHAIIWKINDSIQNQLQILKKNKLKID